LHVVDGADVDAIGADHVGMLLDLAEVGHGYFPLRFAVAPGEAE
jgi:hypothetical protein